jgi:hypothetical protein
MAASNQNRNRFNGHSLALDSDPSKAQCAACYHDGSAGSEIIKDACPLRVHLLCRACAKACEGCILCARVNEASPLFPVADGMLKEMRLQTLAELQAADRQEEVRSQPLRTRSGRISWPVLDPHDARNWSLGRRSSSRAAERKADFEGKRAVRPVASAACSSSLRCSSRRSRWFWCCSCAGCACCGCSYCCCACSCRCSKC